MKPILFFLSFFTAFGVYAQQNNPHLMQDTLQDVVIKNKTAKRVLHSAREYVVDYDFVADKVLVASYSGNVAKLFLLNKDGDTSFLTRLPDEPNGLFQSCLGTHYCVGYDGLYPLDVDTGQIAIYAPYDLEVLKQLQECQFATKDRFYYKMVNLLYLRVLFGYRNKGDARFHPIFNSRDRKNWYSIIDPNNKTNHMEPSLRLKFLKEAMAYLDQPLFLQNDTLIAFDLKNKFIRRYNLDGQLLGETPIQFSWKNIRRTEIIEDVATRQLYLHRFDDNIEHTIARIDMATGGLSSTIKIEKNFPSKLRIYNNDIYFLWQNSAEPSTQQLYVQRGF